MSDKLYLYPVSRGEGYDYDDYDSFVCVASSKEEARNTIPFMCIEEETKDYPNSEFSWEEYKTRGDKFLLYGGWNLEKPENLEIILLGESTNPNHKNREVVCASFNAG